jgi:hypothetical protein
MLTSTNLKENTRFYLTLKYNLKTKNVSLKHSPKPTQYVSFNMLSWVQRNTEDGSSVHRATSNADKKIFLKTFLFARLSHPPELTLYYLSD